MTLTASLGLEAGIIDEMRDLLGFILILAVIFFVVGETRGWYLGVPSQTPILVYKKDYSATTTRRTLMRTDMPVRFSGNVNRGTVTVSVTYERPESMQTSREALPARTIFERTFTAGQRALVDELFTNGGGVYRVIVNYQDATGLFRMSLPGGQDL